MAKSNKIDEGKFENYSDNKSNISASYAPPSNVYLRSEGQVKLDIWLQRFKDDSFCNKNVRTKDSGPDTFDEDRDEIIKAGGYNTTPAPTDAVGIPMIQTLQQYINSSKLFNKNPRNTFFTLSRDYYLARYKDENRKTITVGSYVPTQNQDNYVRDLQLEIIQTS